MSSASDSWFLADDFSGVLEVGAIWKQSGTDVDVVFEASKLTGSKRLCGVSSETRNAGQNESEDRITRILEAAGDRELVFKKIDSTMRGPVGAELNALATRFPDRPILFTPTNPGVGRAVINGSLFIEGVPVSQTSFSRDLAFPVTEDCIQAIITKTGGPSASVASFDFASTQDEGIRQILEKGWKESRILIVDSTTEKDLERVVDAATVVAQDFLPCGSGGLASAVVKHGWPSGLETDSSVPDTKLGRVLFVVGSLHPRSRDQIKYGAEQAGIPIEIVSLESPAGQIERLLKTLRADKVLILASQLPSVAERMSITQVHAHAAHLAELVSEVYSRGMIETLFVTGGETARAVIDRLDCQRLELEAEFQPGVAVAKMTDSRGNQARLIVKPGGFGGPDLLAQILFRYGNI